MFIEYGNEDDLLIVTGEVIHVKNKHFVNSSIHAACDCTVVIEDCDFIDCVFYGLDALLLNNCRIINPLFKKGSFLNINLSTNNLFILKEDERVSDNFRIYRSYNDVVKNKE